MSTALLFEGKIKKSFFTLVYVELVYTDTKIFIFYNFHITWKKSPNERTSKNNCGSLFTEDAEDAMDNGKNF